MIDLDRSDLESILKAMEVAYTHRDDHPDYDLEIAIGDSNGERIGTVKFKHSEYVFEPGS